MQYKTKADLDRSVDELKKLSRTFSRQYLYTNESRANFSLEIDQLIQFAQRDISIHCTSYSGAISIIEEEINNLKQQEFNINTGKAKLFVAIKKKKRKIFKPGDETSWFCQRRLSDICRNRNLCTFCRHGLRGHWRTVNGSRSK